MSVEDQFTVLSSGIVSKLVDLSADKGGLPPHLGEDALYFIERTFSAMYLAPKLTFTLVTRRSTELGARTHLIVRAQIVKLVGDVNDPNRGTFKFDQKRGRNPKDDKDVNYKAEWVLAQKVDVAMKLKRLAERSAPGAAAGRMLPFVNGVLAAGGQAGVV